VRNQNESLKFVQNL